MFVVPFVSISTISLFFLALKSNRFSFLPDSPIFWMFFFCILKIKLAAFNPIPIPTISETFFAASPETLQIIAFRLSGISI